MKDQYTSSYMQELFCPTCKQLLAAQKDVQGDFLYCEKCQQRYAIQHGIPSFGKELPPVTEQYWENIKDTGLTEAHLVEFFPAGKVFNKILDLGCGDGRSTLPIADIGNTTYGIDSSWQQLVYLKQKSSDSIIPIHGDAKQLPFPDNYFDLIISLSVIEHIPKPDVAKVFEEAHRVLKSDGLFLVRNDAWFYRVLEVLRIRPSQLGRRPDETHINMMTGYIFARRLRKAGFKIVQEDHFPFYRYQKKFGIRFPRFLARIFATHSNFICRPIKN